jgi:extradiol dioxygenase family protein
VSRPRFHLAIPVHQIDQARLFYRDTMGFSEGRSAEHWVDFDMFGHQLVIHEVPGGAGVAGTNPVDGDAVPVPHFGALLVLDDWTALADRLRLAGVEFVIEPHVRFEGEIGEQHTMFFFDPSGNALEFKSFADDSQVFATD